MGEGVICICNGHVKLSFAISMVDILYIAVYFNELTYPYAFLYWLFLVFDDECKSSLEAYCLNITKFNVYFSSTLVMLWVHLPAHHMQYLVQVLWPSESLCELCP